MSDLEVGHGVSIDSETGFVRYRARFMHEGAMMDFIALFNPTSAKQLGYKFVQAGCAAEREFEKKAEPAA